MTLHVLCIYIHAPMHKYMHLTILRGCVDGWGCDSQAVCQKHGAHAWERVAEVRAIETYACVSWVRDTYTLFDNRLMMSSVCMCMYVHTLKWQTDMVWDTMSDVQVRASTHSHTYTWMLTHICTHRSIYVHAHSHTCACTHTHRHARIHKLALTHTNK